MLPVPRFKQKADLQSATDMHFKAAEASKLLNYDPMKFDRRMREGNR